MQKLGDAPFTTAETDAAPMFVELGPVNAAETDPTLAAPATNILLVITVYVPEMVIVGDTAVPALYVKVTLAGALMVSDSGTLKLRLVVAVVAYSVALTGTTNKTSANVKRTAKNCLILISFSPFLAPFS